MIDDSNDIDACRAETGDVSQSWVAMSDGVEIRVIDFDPGEVAASQPIVVFVAGWISLLSGWTAVLKEITPRYRVLYVESREKGTSRISDCDAVGFDVPRMAQDLQEIIETCVPGGRPFCLAGSSLGATTILHYLSEERPLPLKAALIAPNPEFRFPTWFRPVLPIFPKKLYGLLKPVIRIYLRYFRLDMENEPEQYEKYVNTLNYADPDKFKPNALSLMDYELWSRLPRIETSCLIIGGRADKLHGMEQLLAMAEKMPNAKVETLASNKETHSGVAGRVIGEWFRG